MTFSSQIQTERGGRRYVRPVVEPENRKTECQKNDRGSQRGGDQPSPPPITQDQVQIFTVKHGLEKRKRGMVAVSYEPTNQPAVDYAVEDCRALLGTGMTVLAAKVLWNEHQRQQSGQVVMTKVRMNYLSRLSKSISQPQRNEKVDETQGLCTQKASQTVAPTERGKNYQEAGTGEF